MEVSALQSRVEEQRNRVHGLQMVVYSQADPAANAILHSELAEEQAKLEQLQCQLTEETAKTAPISPPSEQRSGRGRFLGEKTTGLKVEHQLCMDPLPTGAYHLMNPETEPLLTVSVENVSRDIRRILAKAVIEGLSSEAVRTLEIEPRSKAEFHLQPTLFPSCARQITEVQRAMLHVVVEDLDGKLECHNSFSITCLARTASFNAVRRPDTNELLDLSHYYGAWVTPHAEAVQERIRRAVELAPDRRLMGYQGDPESVNGQVAALYGALQEAQIVYVNSVIDYGAPAGMTTQRTRLPREALASRSANCIDGTVLLASLMEGISLNPAIVLVPGHAFVGWETWFGSEEWEFLETTMMASADFDAARQSGNRQHEQFTKYNRDRLKIHPLTALRERGIWPME